MNSSDLPDSVARNVADWTKSNAAYANAKAPEAWATNEITWGVFRVPEATLGVIGDVADLDVVELGCGTAYFSAWLAKRGARPVGVDPTPAQLATARRMQTQTGIEFPLVEAAAEAVRCRTRRSTSPYQSTVRRCGPCPSVGSRRRRACCGREAASSS
jgi:SAM-dependent methyltransferase